MGPTSVDTQTGQYDQLDILAGFDPSIEDDPSWWASRLTLVRGFATYLHTIDPATQVPPADLLRAHPRHATPYLYTAEDVAALLAAAAGLRTTHRVATYRTLIGLLVVTGMRVGEAIALDLRDFDEEQGLITVRQGKLGKSCALPLHPTATTAVQQYLDRVDRPAPRHTAALFVSLVHRGQHPLHVVIGEGAGQSGVLPFADGRHGARKCRPEPRRGRPGSEKTHGWPWPGCGRTTDKPACPDLHELMALASLGTSFTTHGRSRPPTRSASPPLRCGSTWPPLPVVSSSPIEVTNNGASTLAAAPCYDRMIVRRLHQRLAAR